MNWYDPRIVLAFTVPIVFIGIIVGKSVSPMLFLMPPSLAASSPSSEPSSMES